MTPTPRQPALPLLPRLAPVLALLAALLVLPLALASRADAFIYWVNPAEGTIGRANLDGTGVNGQFVSEPDPARDVEVDQDHIYWTGGSYDPGFSDPTAIGRANLDGTNVNPMFISPFAPARAASNAVENLAIAEDHLYWTEGSYGSTIPAQGTVNRANLDGTGIEENFIPFPPPPGVYYYGAKPGDIAVDASHLYWGESGPLGTAIGRANLDGTGVDHDFIPTSPVTWDETGSYVGGLGAIAVDAQHIYWTNPGTNSIARANLDGTEVDESFIGGLDASFIFPFGDLAVDANHIYWTTPGPRGWIARANLDGTGVDESFIEVVDLSPDDVEGLRGIAVDGLSDTTPPQTKITKGSPNKTEKTKLKFEFKSSEPNSSFECKLDRKKWKSCESPKTVKRLEQGKHKFEVRAIDHVGNVDPTPAKDKFKVVG